MKCPTCGRPVELTDNPDRPFCSERCKLIDFGKWANEEYRVPEERATDVEDLEQAGEDFSSLVSNDDAPASLSH